MPPFINDICVADYTSKLTGSVRQREELCICTIFVHREMGTAPDMSEATGQMRYPEFVENGGPDMGKPRSISQVVFDCDIQSSQ